MGEQKEAVLARVKRTLELDFTIIEEDTQRPWGGFYRIADSQAGRFIESYFKGIVLPEEVLMSSLSPKVLVVEPEKRLSWQVHKRRSEIWRVVEGPVGVVLSGNDHQPKTPTVYKKGQIVNIPSLTRHRLVGLGGWGLVAEIWVHTTLQNPSDERDIRRIEDDFERAD